MNNLQLILIDPDRQTVTVVGSGGTLKEFYQQLDCRLVDVVCRQDNGDALTIDDEGCFRESTSGFYFNGEGPFVGKAIVSGTDRNGDTANPAYSVAEVRALVEWQGQVMIEPEIVVFSWQ